MVCVQDSQAQLQGSELAQPHVYPIYDLLEHVKGSVLQIQSCRISPTQARIQYDDVAEARGLELHQ